MSNTQTSSNGRLAAQQTGEILTATEAARMLRISKQSMIRRFKDGSVSAIKLGSVWRVHSTVIAKLVPNG